MSTMRWSNQCAGYRWLPTHLLPLHVACSLMLELAHALARQAGGLPQVGPRRPALPARVQMVELPPEVVHLRQRKHNAVLRQLRG